MLSPMLFNIYMKLLDEVSRGSGLCCHQYAEDIQLSFTLLVPRAQPTPSEDGWCIINWMRICNLKLNLVKMEMWLVELNSTLESVLFVSSACVPADSPGMQFGRCSGILRC